MLPPSRLKVAQPKTHGIPGMQASQFLDHQLREVLTVFRLYGVWKHSQHACFSGRYCCLSENTNVAAR